MLTIPFATSRGRGAISLPFTELPTVPVIRGTRQRVTLTRHVPRFTRDDGQDLRAALDAAASAMAESSARDLQAMLAEDLSDSHLSGAAML